MHQTIENTQTQHCCQQYNGTQMPNIASIKLSYSFDYGCFANPDLENRAKSTLGSFFRFMRASFDGLLEIGRALQELYKDCLASCPDGKKVFEKWISSPDFGSSTYLAKSSMEIYNWFQSLHLRKQEFLLSSVQRWSVSALRQLRKVATEFLEEVVSGGQKTAAEVKRAAKALSTPSAKTAANNQAPSEEEMEKGEESKDEEFSPCNDHPAPLPVLAPGTRIVVTGNDTGWNNHTGIIMSNYGDKFWVLMDHTIFQGQETKHLFKPEQLQLELKVGVNSKLQLEDLFTAEQVEQKIEEALAVYKKKQAEEKLDEFVKIQNTAPEIADAEIQSDAQQAHSLEQTKQELLKQLELKEQELKEVYSLQIRNQQLEQRVEELEKALLASKKNTFKEQVDEAPNSEVPLALQLLMCKVEYLENVVSMKEEEIQKWRQFSESNTEIEEIIKEFGVCGESLGWKGWNRHGYRAADGTLHKDINAIASFIFDLKQEYCETPSVGFKINGA